MLGIFNWSLASTSTSGVIQRGFLSVAPLKFTNAGRGYCHQRLVACGESRCIRTSLQFKGHWQTTNPWVTIDDTLCQLLAAATDRIKSPITALGRQPILRLFFQSVRQVQPMSIIVCRIRRRFYNKFLSCSFRSRKTSTATVVDHQWDS